MKLSSVGLVIFTAVLFCAGCSASYKNEVLFNPTEPIRVAVLPFNQAGVGNTAAEQNANQLIDNVPIVSSKLEETPASFVQKQVQAELSRTGVDLVAPGYVEVQLVHHGFGHEGAYDYDAIAKAPPRLWRDLMTADAVLTGTVTEWDRSYYGIQSVSTVGVDLKLIRLADNKVLFSSSAKDSDSRGITKIPTGFSSLVVEPIRGLDNEIISNLARDMVSKMISPLVIKSRPEYLQTAPPSILGSSHDHRGGAIGRNDSLIVVMLGTPKKTATFSIGNSITQIPMNEVDLGHYVGEYFPEPVDRFADEDIYVYLSDEFGRTSKQKVALGPVSLGGSPPLQTAKKP